MEINELKQRAAGRKRRQAELVMINRRRCGECIFQELKGLPPDYETRGLWCREYHHWLTEDNKQITLFNGELCGFEGER